MKKRKTFTRLLCAAVSVATAAAIGGVALADETDVAEVEEPSEIVEEQPEADEAEVIADETEAEETEAPEEVSEEDALEAEEIIDEVEVIEDEVIVDVIADEDALEVDTIVADEVITVEEETVIFEEAEAVKNGWKKEDGKWYYYQDGERVTGWQKIDGKWYYFDLNYNYMVTGGMMIEGKIFIFGTDGAMLTGLVECNGAFYYLTANGAKRGWVKIDNKWHYFNDDDEDPYMLRTTVKTIGEYTYIFDENGVMQTGWTKPYGAYNPGSYSPAYYCDADGHMQTGWLKLDGKWYYLDPVRAEGFRTFYDEVSGEETDYFFDENGVMQTGWVMYTDSMVPYGRIWYYFGSNGVAADGWTKIGNKWYYFEDGCVVTGSQTIEGKTYYFGDYLNQDGSFNSNVGVMCTGWRSARYQTGPYEFSTCWYYYGSDGAMVTGWKKIDNKWYYFNESYNTGLMAVGVCSIRNSKSGAYERYCFSSSGVMQTNHWERYGRTWRYFGSNGIQVYEWQQIKGSWYYFDEGNMVTGLVWMNGVWFDFGTNGACVNPPSDPSLYYIEHVAYK